MPVCNLLNRISEDVIRCFQETYDFISWSMNGTTVDNIVDHVIYEINRNLSKYGRSVRCSNTHITKNKYLTIETIDSEGSIYGAGVKLADPNDKAQIIRAQRMLISNISAAYEELYLI